MNLNFDGYLIHLTPRCTSFILNIAGHEYAAGILFILCSFDCAYAYLDFGRSWGALFEKEEVAPTFVTGGRAACCHNGEHPRKFQIHKSPFTDCAAIATACGHHRRPGYPGASSDGRNEFFAEMLPTARIQLFWCAPQN